MFWFFQGWVIRSISASAWICRTPHSWDTVTEKFRPCREVVWGFQVTASVVLPTDSQHQLAALWVRHLGYPVKSSLQMTAASARTSSITCKAQCKMKILGSLFKMYLENQDGNNRTLNQAWGPSKNGVLCDCTGHSHEAHPGASRLWLQPVERS